MTTNKKLLIDCPCPRLARVARLATILIGQSLRTAGILIYAVIGRFAPYVGQLGGKTRCERTPLRRLVEHIQRAKFLYNHFVGQRRRHLRTAGKMGHRPSLARTLARLGGHKASILPLQVATRRNVDSREHEMEAALAPTLNGVTPYRGLQNAEWIFQDLHNFTRTKAMQQVASEVITAPRIKFSAPQLVHILVESRPILHSRTFERLFAKVSKTLHSTYHVKLPRRIPFQVPAYAPSLLAMARKLALRHMKSLDLPTPIQRWFATALTVLPKATPTVASQVQGWRATQSNRAAKGQGTRLPGRMESIGTTEVIKTFELSSAEAQSRIRNALPPVKCNCNYLKRKFPTLFNGSQRHALCRTPEQWESLMPRELLPAMLQNCRNSTLPSQDFIDGTTQKLHEQFEAFFDSSDASAVFPRSMIHDVLTRESQEYVQKYPWTANECLTECNNFLRSHRLTVAVWDKKPTDMYALCSAVYEQQMLEATVLSPSFSLVGVETRKGGAQVFIQSRLHKSASQHGILHD